MMQNFSDFSAEVDDIKWHMPDHRHQDVAWVSAASVCTRCPWNISYRDVGQLHKSRWPHPRDSQIAVSAQTLSMLLLKAWSLLDSCARSMQ